MSLIPIGTFRGDQTGVALALYAADDRYQFEIQRAPDASGSPDTGSAVSLGTVDGTATIAIDALPVTGTVYWYRLRHVGFGDTPSGWTDWVSATAATLPQTLVRPSLSPSMTARITTESTSAATITFTGVGLVTLDIDGAGYTTPSASPLTVTKDADRHIYTFRATIGGRYAEVPIIIEAGTRGLSISTGDASNAGATGPPFNRLVINFAFSGMPSGTTFDVSYANDSGGGGGSTGNSSSPVTFNGVTFGGLPGAGTMTVIAQGLDGTTLRTVTKHSTYTS